MTTIAIVLSLLICPLMASSLPGDSQTEGSQSLHSQQQIAQARVGGLDPQDYIDEAGELDVMANQQQIPTAQLMAAAGHLIPDNFFLPGGSVPSLYSAQAAARFAQQLQHHQHSQQQQQQQQQQQSSQHQQQLASGSADPLQQVSSHVHPRHVAASKYRGVADLMAAMSQQQQQHQTAEQQEVAAGNGQLIDFNSYNIATQPDPRDQAAQVDLAEFLASPSQPGMTLYEQQQQQYLTEQQLAAELAALQQHHQQQQQQQSAQQHSSHSSQQQVGDIAAQASGDTAAEQYAIAAGGSAIGPDYQITGLSQDLAAYGAYNSYDKEGAQQTNAQQKPYGLPTRSSNKEPNGMLKPLGNPKTISSPAIDFITNQLPKNTGLEKLADKIPQSQTPTVFSFSSSKDPVEKVKSVNQKKRNVMRQAEQLVRATIKTVNEKFGTNIGDQTDIPFLLSSLGPLGFAQNVLFDPTLLITLLNQAEKTYLSDVLPGPAKMAIRPVLNIFRVPNKKRDKANLLNIISYLASGGQTGTPSKHRQSIGIERKDKDKEKDKNKSSR